MKKLAFSLSAVIAALVLSLEVSAAPLSVEPSSRTQSRLFYDAIYPASEDKPIQWTGNVDAGIAGTTGKGFKNAVLLRINFFRAFAGVSGDIKFNSTYNSKDQQAALMMAANNALSHSPPPSWKFYTAGGAEAAAESNLALGAFGTEAIDGYVEDPGSNNADVGHRRWLFYPQTKLMGTGDIPETESYLGANALWIFDDNFLDPRPVTRDDFVAWPPPGFVPVALVYPRWSFSYPNADFTSTVVSMKNGAVTLPIQIESRSPGAGENTIVWIPTLNAEPSLSSDVVLNVTLTNVKIDGVSQNFSYQVTVFNEGTRVGEPKVLPITGDSTPTVGSSTIYSVKPLGFATRMQAKVFRQTTLNWTEGAENGTARVEFVKAAALTGFAPVANSGANSFHLMQPDFQDESVTFKNPILPISKAPSLTFYSRLGYATSAQTAKVQVSQNGGTTWFTVWQKTGTNGIGESAFTKQTVSLSGLRNAPILVRLYMEFSGNGSVYTTIDPTVGWLVDDIKFGGCQELTYPKSLASQSAWSFSFKPTKPGKYYLQARPQLFGYYSGWEPGKTVTAAMP